MGSVGEEQVRVNGHEDSNRGSSPQRQSSRKTIVVVGLGMVGIAFIEKLLKFDAKRREYDVIVIGEVRRIALTPHCGIKSSPLYRRQSQAD